MGTKYQSQSSSGYDASPPPDDGSTTSSNQITWSGIKSKLSDPISTLASAINSQLVTALDTSASTSSVNYTTVAGDHQKPILCTGTITISLGDATTMGVGYQAVIVNHGSGTITVAVATSTDTLNGTTNGTLTLTPGDSATFEVNSTHNGYRAISGFYAKLQGTSLTNGQLLVGSTNAVPVAAALTGTANQVNVTNGAGSITLSLPQSIAAASSPTFAGLALTGLADLSNASAGQIKFPATQNASSDANTLDDYEEGTWTPSLGGTTTYTTQAGRFTKIGRLVAIEWKIVVNAIGTGSTVQVTGLPFTVAANASCQIGYFASAASNLVFLTGLPSLGGTAINMYSLVGAGTTTGSNNVFGNSTNVVASSVYSI